jgi:lysophospholipase L1-like esterase
MLAGQLKFSSSFMLVNIALLLAACSDAADPPGAMTAGTGSMSTAGTTSAHGGSAGSSAAGAASAGIAGAASGSAGTPNGGTGGVAGGSAGGVAGGSAGGVAGGSTGGVGGSGGAAGRGGTGGAAGGAAGAAGQGGSSAGAGGAVGFQPCPASGACKIMPFGDSITQGFNVAGGYRAPLLHLALAAKRTITFVGSASDYSVPTVDGTTFPKNHEGHGGYTIEGNNGIAQFVSTSIPNFKPNIITLMIGTNDINGNVSVSDAPNRLGKLLDAIYMRDPNILVVLAQIVPSRTDGTNNAIKTYNAAMPNLVSTRVGKGQHIVLVDMYAAFTSDANYKQSLLADNLHPNQTGYNGMADVWFEALSPYLH